MPKAKQPKPTNALKTGSKSVAQTTKCGAEDGDRLPWPKISPKKGLSVDCIIEDQIYVIDVSLHLFPAGAPASYDLSSSKRRAD